MTEEYRARLIVSRFALPCLRVRVLKGKMSSEDYARFEERCKEGRPMEKSELESLLPNESRRRKQLGVRMEKNPWSMEVVKTYWSVDPNGHNRVIDSGEDEFRDAPNHHKEMCKVHEAVVRKIDGDKILVGYEGVERKVYSALIENPRVGDTVLVHLTDAIFRKEEYNSLIKLK